MTKKMLELERRINKILAQENRVLAEGVVEQYFKEKAKEAIENDQLVDTLLKSLGQSRSENEQKAEEKEKSLDKKNSLANILRYCEIAADKEAANGHI